MASIKAILKVIAVGIGALLACALAHPVIELCLRQNTNPVLLWQEFCVGIVLAFLAIPGICFFLAFAILRPDRNTCHWWYCIPTALIVAFVSFHLLSFVGSENGSESAARLLFAKLILAPVMGYLFLCAVRRRRQERPIEVYIEDEFD